MPHHSAPKKHLRASERRRKRNFSDKRTLRSTLKTAMAALGTPEEAEARKSAESLLDKSGKKHLIHPRTAARRKSRLAKAARRASQKS